MNTSIVNFAFGFLVFFTLPGCVSYRSILPDTLSMGDDCFSTWDKGVEISMIDNVLSGPHNKMFARMERKNKVELIAVKIFNSSQNEINVARDLVFLTNQGDSIFPFPLEPAVEMLIKPVSFENPDNGVEVETSSDIKLMWGAGKFFNKANKLKSQFKFLSDMKNYYLQDREIPAGMNESGFLLLPVRKGTPVIVFILNK